MVTRRVDRFVRLGPPRRDHAVAVGVEDRRAPPLGRLGIFGLVPDLGVDPADAFPEPVVEALVFAELVVVGREAGVDLAERLGVRVVHERLPRAALDRKVVGECVRAVGAEARLLISTADATGQPDAPLTIHRHASWIRLPRPNRIVAVVRRGRRVGQDRGGVRRDLNVERPMLDRVEHGKNIARLHDAVDQTVRIKALFMTVWCPDSRSVESNCGIPRG